MIELKLDNGVSVVMYNSIKELPIDVSKKFHYYMLQVMGVGNTMEDVDDHLVRLISFVTNDKKDDALEELKNLRFGFFSMLSAWDFKSLAFACLIKSVNGNEINDRSDEGLDNLITDLSLKGLTNEKAETAMEEIKKNWIQKGNFGFRSSSERIGIA